MPGSQPAAAPPRAASTSTHKFHAGPPLVQAAFEVATPFQVLHRQYALDVAAADAGKGWDVVWYGDSIVERLRGTQGG